ncbi:MAG TPA: M23 family metallopeptidase [Longimicrobiales bacterium]|nr:M23 family metallopeptidase [Longimicrobiales bacterium]
MRSGPRLLTLAAALAAISAAACATSPPPRPDDEEMGVPLPPPLPDTAGWGVHVLALERGPDGSLWVGTYGEGIFVLRRRSQEWERIAPGGGDSIAWGYVNSIAFGRDSTVWYGTVGNGFGRSGDGGRTWRNWTLRDLGPQWQYVAPQGITARGDTVYVATADGLRITEDAGESWLCVQARSRIAGGATRTEDACGERIHALPSKYLLSLDVAADGAIRVGHLGGLSVSRDGGRSWTDVAADGLTGRRVRAVRAERDTAVWAATEAAIFADLAFEGAFEEVRLRIPGLDGLPGAIRGITGSPGTLPPLILTSHGMIVRNMAGDYRVYYLAAAERYRPAGDIWAATWAGPPLWPVGGSGAGLARVLAGNLPSPDIVPTGAPALPTQPRHVWFERPIADGDGNPHVDGAYLYGGTMGGSFQQHQGIEFNNPAGTPVRAVGDGTVVFAGVAESGANAVAIRHDRQWEDRHIFSTYYHHTSIDVVPGQRVAAGDIIARVGNTGRATNDHLHFEVHAAPSADAVVIDAGERFPPHSVNPQLWIRPLPGTGIVAGQVFDREGDTVPGARIYGLVLAYPTETPFSFAETYREHARGSPAYGEHFAVGDVPAGDYTVGVTVDGARIWRRVRVRADQLTWVEFRP